MGGRLRPGVGVNQLKCPATAPSAPTCPAPGDPVRYGTLSHPGDSYSYDIFSQAGQAIRDNSAQILGGLTPKKLIAAGESQSAGRMVTYIDAVQPLVHVYDGFLVHSRGAARCRAVPVAASPPMPAPSPTLIRTDLGVPVFVFQTESDVAGGFTAAAARHQSVPPVGGRGHVALRHLRLVDRSERHR